MILTFALDGASAVISFLILSDILGYIELPPARTTFSYISFRRSMSHFPYRLIDQIMNAAGFKTEN